MLTLRDLAQLAAVTPHLGDIKFYEAASFIRLAKLVRPQIEFTLVDKREPPALLPPHIHEFMGASLRKSYTEVNWYWYTLKDAVWGEGAVRATETDVEMFHLHGLRRGIGYRDMLPPTRVCLNPGCRNHRSTDNVKTLTEPVSHRATLFTLREGALPVHTTSLYCHPCHRRYHLNYAVGKARSVRTYYHGPPPTVIQISTHFFVEASVLELFGNMMMFGWLSAHNCAQVYNTCLASIDVFRRNNPLVFNVDMGQPPLSWPYALEMSGETAMNGFLLYSVLLNRAEQLACIELPHDCPTQRDRLSAVLAELNKAMEGVGHISNPSKSLNTCSS
ncbi:hypothetical protein BC628DRAFT_1325118 [Trametes gibbosa]|nr:hypothetical protein BC628DRAFT_1325118 [Trametes gibbosa]